MNQPIEETEVSFSDQLLAEAGFKNPNQNPVLDPKDDPNKGNPGAAPNEKPAEGGKDDSAGKDPEKISNPGTETNIDPAGENKNLAAPQGKTDAPPPADEIDLDDEKLLAALRKKTGRDYKSLDELNITPKELTDDEKKQAAESKRAASIKFGTDQNLFSQQQYDNYVAFAAKDPLDVVRDSFIADLRTENPALSDQDGEDLFDEFYHTLEDETSAKYKRGQSLIQKEYDALKSKDYDPILKVGQLYDNFQENASRAQTYRSQVDKLFAEKLPAKFEFTIDGENVTFPIDYKDKKVSDFITAIKSDNYLTVEMMNSTLDQTGKVDEAVLLKEITKDLREAVLTNMVSEVAKSYADIMVTKAKLGRKAIIEDNTSNQSGLHSTVAEKGISDQMLAEAGYPVGVKK